MKILPGLILAALFKKLDNYATYGICYAVDEDLVSKSTLEKGYFYYFSEPKK
jgi:hypothetical protein